MHAGKLVFAQVMEFAPWYTFRRLVTKYRGNFNVRTFSCLDQFLCMAFAQLTYRESLRDIQACLRAQPAKLYHLGLHGKVSRSALADANESRDWRIYGEFAQALIRIATIGNTRHALGGNGVCTARYRSIRRNGEALPCLSAVGGRWWVAIFPARHERRAVIELLHVRIARTDRGQVL